VNTLTLHITRPQLPGTDFKPRQIQVKTPAIPLLSFVTLCQPLSYWALQRVGMKNLIRSTLELIKLTMISEKSTPADSPFFSIYIF
jgi:hypothetical protein